MPAGLRGRRQRWPAGSGVGQHERHPYPARRNHPARSVGPGRESSLSARHRDAGASRQTRQAARRALDPVCLPHQSPPPPARAGPPPLVSHRCGAGQRFCPLELAGNPSPRAVALGVRRRPARARRGGRSALEGCATGVRSAGRSTRFRVSARRAQRWANIPEAFRNRALRRCFPDSPRSTLSSIRKFGDDHEP